MRILIFLPALTLGGAERQGLLVAQYLRDRGHNVALWAFPPPGNSASLIPEIERLHLPYHELPDWPNLNWRFAELPFSRSYLRGYYYDWRKRLQRLADSFPSQTFDAVIPFTFWPSLAATLLRRRLGARKWYWTQRGGYDDAGVPYTKFLKARVLAHRPRFLANSTAGGKFLEDTFGLRRGDVTIIPNAYASDEEAGPDPGVFERDSAELSLVHVANFYPEKDYDTVFRALQILQGRGTRCRLHVCGAFPQTSDGPKMFDRLRQLGVKDLVEYHGPTPRSDVMKLLRQADIGLLSTRSEGQPNSVMEYMHAGLPVVATNIPGVRDVVGPDNEPFLFDVGDAGKLADLIGELQGDRALRHRLGLRNRERIVTTLSPERILPQWAELLEDERTITSQP
jgi:glycosyltransferase involved in cell wall biosynthesis